MKNNAARILRMLIAKKFDTRPEKIQLSGIISPEFIQEFDFGVSYVDTWEEGELYAFNSDGSITPVDGPTGGTVYYNGNHDQRVVTPKPLHECVQGDELFFINKVWGSERGDNYLVITVYFAPNFKKVWEKIQEKDIDRWEQWLM